MLKAWFHGVHCSILSCMCLNVCKMSVWPDQHLCWIQSVTLIKYLSVNFLLWCQMIHLRPHMGVSSHLICRVCQGCFPSAVWRSLFIFLKICHSSVSVCFYDVSQLMSFQPPFLTLCGWNFSVDVGLKCFHVASASFQIRKEDMLSCVVFLLCLSCIVTVYECCMINSTFLRSGFKSRMFFP